MKPTASLQISPGTWTYAWSSEPGAETLIYEATNQGDLEPGAVYIWSINADGTRFESEDGDVLSATSGTFSVPFDCGVDPGDGGGSVSC